VNKALSGHAQAGHLLPDCTSPPLPRACRTGPPGQGGWSWLPKPVPCRTGPPGYVGLSRLQLRQVVGASCHHLGSFSHHITDTDTDNIKTISDCNFA